MKTKILILFLALSGLSFAQNSAKKTYFAQCALSNLTQENFVQLEAQIKANPDVLVVRLDPISNTLFLLTKESESFSIVEFNNLLGVFVANATCVNIGVRGVDFIKPNPKQNCNE